MKEIKKYLLNLMSVLSKPLTKQDVFQYSIDFRRNLIVTNFLSIVALQGLLVYIISELQTNKSCQCCIEKCRYFHVFVCSC